MQNSTQSYTNHEEWELIKRAKEDAAQFGVLYDKYYKLIFVFVLSRIKEKETTADVVQQVFLKAMLSIQKYENRGFPFSSWLYRIALNEINMYFRGNKVVEIEIQEKDVKFLVEEIGYDGSEEKISYCLQLIEKLPLDQSQLIEMRFFDKLSFQEIGHVLKITEANAKMRLYRILEKLKTDLLNLLKG